MTRFARAKGSKASNERVPEQATKWNELKSQLESKKLEKETAEKRKEMEQIRQENYDKFLKERLRERVEATVWSDFPCEESRAKKKVKPDRVGFGAENEAHTKKNNGADRKKKKNKSSEEVAKRRNKQSQQEKVPTEKTAQEMSCSDFETDLNKQEIIPATEVPERKKKKKRQLTSTADEEETNEVAPVRKKKKTKKLRLLTSEEETSCNDLVTDLNKQEDVPTAEIPKKNKKKKRQSTSTTTDKEETNDVSPEAPAARPEISEEQIERFRAKSGWRHLTDEQITDKIHVRRMRRKREKASMRRTKQSEEARLVQIGGVTVQIVSYDGFWIRQSDARALHALKNDLIQKGVPSNAVQNTIKLRRRAFEKALSREMNTVCYNCRKTGHVVSDCKELDAEQHGTGICYKCGSTEHAHLQCRSSKSSDSGQDFKFAHCFICKQQGHISRQCPENPRGLYPKGGACKLCGDVTHFKKDCPSLQAQAEKENEISVGTMFEEDGLEDIPEVKGKKRGKEADGKRIKKVKF